MSTPRIIFLHIPKTAGQSVHAALRRGFGAENLCPARVNEQLVGLSIEELNRYRVFSGHLDWCLLDCLDGPKYVFTVLRDPRERLMSYYFYVRREARQMSATELALPANQGKKAILDLSAHDYLCGDIPHLRHFIDMLFDNFYTYYFAGRYFQARSMLLEQQRQGLLSRESLLATAESNLRRLDGVFSVEDMPSILAAIRERADFPILADTKYHRNANPDVPQKDRRKRLVECGATAETFSRLDEYCAMDNVLWERFGRHR